MNKKNIYTYHIFNIKIKAFNQARQNLGIFKTLNPTKYFLAL